ncbi:protein Flattop isoform X1 [Nerophis lumbriciformis]|uniref:protein Flattop isoform X1 n=1 Tax=Nerophis lumbriciformis TaxID=546530 RepID=UPI003BACA66E
MQRGSQTNSAINSSVVANMSTCYSANQYDDAFRPKRLQNWCQAKQVNKSPRPLKGHTTFVADNRGHLIPGMVKKGSAWPDFKGTWDLPARIPAQNINPTSRSVEGMNRLKAWGIDPQHTGKSGPLGGSKNTDGPKGAGWQRSRSDISAALSTNLPVTADHKYGRQKQVTHADRASYIAEGQTAAASVMSAQSQSESTLCSEGVSTRPNTGSIDQTSPRSVEFRLP